MYEGAFMYVHGCCTKVHTCLYMCVVQRCIPACAWVLYEGAIEGVWLHDDGDVGQAASNGTAAEATKTDVIYLNIL